MDEPTITAKPQPAIEAERIALETRKWLPKPPKMVGTPARQVKVFSLSMHGDASITEAIADGVALDNPAAETALGAKIMGERLWGYAGELSRPKVANLTSGHKGTAIQAKNHALVRIETPLRQLVAGGIEAQVLLPKSSK